MVYTLTANPSLDYIMNVPRLVAGETNRSKRERIVAGGKGLNVALVLKDFGVPVKAFGMIAGFTGEEWLRQASSQVDVEVIRLEEGETRINVKVAGVEETEVNASGPTVPLENRAQFEKMLDQLDYGDVLVISGNAGPGFPADSYGLLMDYLEGKNVKIIVDATGEQMRNALSRRPYLIKPNIEELKDIANTCVESEEDVIGCCERLIRMGAQNVLVSAGANGALWVGGDGRVFQIGAPPGRVKNTVGSGDAMVAAFLYGELQNMDIVDCVKLAVAAGSAGAFSEGLPTREDTLKIVDSLEVRVIAGMIEL